MTSRGSTSGVVTVGRQPKRAQEHLRRYNGLALGVDRPMLNMHANLDSLPLSSFYRSYIPILCFPEAMVVALQDRTVSDTHMKHRIVGVLQLVFQLAISVIRTAPKHR